MRKCNNLSFIIVIMSKLIKMIYYIPVYIIINMTNLIKIIINVIIKYYGLQNFTILNKNF